MQKHGRNLSFVLFCLFMLPIAHAQNDVPIHPVDGEYITKWLVLGPFFPDDLEKDFLVDVGGEANIQPKEGDTVFTAKGDTLTWKRYQTQGSHIALSHAVGYYEHTTAYAYCILRSEAERKVQILLGSDDGASVWINGEQVYHNPVYRPLTLDEDLFEAGFLAGANSCLVKVFNGLGYFYGWDFAMRAFPHNQPVLVTPKFFLSSDHLKDEIGLSGGFWKYHRGDNAEWASLVFDDSEWETTNTQLNPNNLPKSGWQGVGWFRLHIVVDSTLINKPLGLSIWQAGTSQLYLDGTLIYTFGEHRDDWTGAPKVITFDGKKRHVIAVRYSNLSVKKFHSAGYNAGFFLQLGKVNRMAEERIRKDRSLIGYQMFLTSLPLGIGLLHLILFAFFPSLKQNLFFALFLFSYAINTFFDYQISLSPDIGQNLFFLRMLQAPVALVLLFQLRVVYSLFYKALPKQFWLISLAAFILCVRAIYNPIENIGLFNQIVGGVIFIEIIRVILIALFKKREGAWIIGLAYLVFMFFSYLQGLKDKGINVPFLEAENPFAFGSISFIIAISVYLSRDFARTNKNLETQLVQVKELSEKSIRQERERAHLEAENARKSQELEEARQLQLSMLPKELPELPHLEIGVFMKTATEVGGDYYDFHLADNGTLTVAIGDATGHGMKAGTMVASMKSLFGTYDENSDIPYFFNKCSNIIKRMKLGNLHMAMLLVRISGHKMIASAAGIPPIYIYRSESKSIEEILIKGMPLGGFTSFPYKQREISLAPGDTVLLMSDGFAELFNDKDEMLDYPRAKEIFKEAADRSADDIIAHLNETGERWSNRRPQDDDITFVVLKVKHNAD
jgi:serine phosphatase RsbU (regulator of sigma subunit)